MPIAVWPPQLPTKPLAEGYEIGGDPKGRIGSQTDIGPGKQRRRAALRTKDLKLTIPIPVADFRTYFEPFYETTLREGVLPFEFPHPETGATLRVRFAPGEVPGYKAPLERGGKYKLVSMTLQILP